MLLMFNIDARESISMKSNLVPAKEKADATNEILSEENTMIKQQIIYK